MTVQNCSLLRFPPKVGIIWLEKNLILVIKFNRNGKNVSVCEDPKKIRDLEEKYKEYIRTCLLFRTVVLSR